MTVRWGDDRYRLNGEQNRSDVTLSSRFSIAKLDVWRLIRTPEPLSGDTRIVDLLPFLAVISVGAAIRLLVWDTNWVLISFPIGLALAVWARIRIPDAQQPPDES